MSLTKLTSIKVKVSKDEETEIRRLRFSRQISLNFGLPGTSNVKEHYTELLSFLMSSLSELYPDLQLGSFNEHVVFSVKDEDDDMVSFSSEEEYLVAISDIISKPPHSDVPYGPIIQVEDSMRFEVKVLKSKSAVPTNQAPYMNRVPTSEVPPPAEMKSVAAPLREDSVPGSAPSDNGSPEFIINMSDSVTSSSTASRDPVVGTASAAAPPGALPGAPPAASHTPPPSPASTSAHITANSAGPFPTTGMAPPASPHVFGDPSAPTRAFLTQLLPGLAEVFARSMYATQWAASQAVPTPLVTPPPAPVAPAVQTPPSNVQATNQLDPTAAGLAAAAAATAVNAVNAAAAVHSAASVPFQTYVPAESTKSADVQAPNTAMTGEGQSSSSSEAQNPVMPPAPRASPTVSQSEGSEPPVVHTGIVCDGCDMSPIVGIRYKCAVRHDFDLCEACEAGAGTDSPFPFLKIRNPAQSPAALICMLRPDQPGSVEEALATCRFSNRRSSPCPRVNPATQARRAPQRGGWGEGRRNIPRWMKEAARRHATAAAGGGAPVGPTPWCGPRMQRNRQDEDAPAHQKSHDEPQRPKEEATAVKDDRDPPTNPASVASSVSGEDPLFADDTAAVSEPVEQETLGTPTLAVEESSTVDMKPLPDVASSLSTSHPVAESTQSTESVDMLAASMRSLASSMTTTLSMGGSSTQDKSRASYQGDGKLHVKPMARFVTDVSVADGSPLPPNTRFVKTWCMRNDGTITFPPGCRLMPSGGDLMEGPEEGIPVEQRSPGEEFHVSVSLTTPPKSGRYIGYWRLRTAEGQNFGHRIWADVLVTGGTADLIDEASLDGDWDLVNMQRLSKAVEDTAKDAGNVAADAAIVAAAAAAAATAATHAAVAGDAPADERVAAEVAPPLADTEKPDDAVASGDDSLVETNDPAPADYASFPDNNQAMVGHEEMKSSDAEDMNTQEVPMSIGGDVVPPASEEVTPQAELQPQLPMAKWHRELCSLAEMGFEDTARNIRLLEKHLAHSGAPGMERVLHELLSWTEISYS